MYIILPVDNVDFASMSVKGIFSDYLTRSYHTFTVIGVYSSFSLAGLSYMFSGDNFKGIHSCIAIVY